MLKSGGDNYIFVPPTQKTGGDASPPSPPGSTPLIVWGNCSADALSQLTSAQRRAARILVNADYATPSLTLFQDFQHLQIIPCLSTLISRKQQPVSSQSQGQRRKTQVFVPGSFLVVLWNRFPKVAKKLTTTRGFRSFCKAHFKNKLSKD
jgi:hypothetical protein